MQLRGPLNSLSTTPPTARIPIPDEVNQTAGRQ
jgi:hypothetical protein